MIDCNPQLLTFVIDKPIVLDDERNNDMPTTIRQVFNMRMNHLIKLEVLIATLYVHIRRPVDDDESSDYEDNNEVSNEAESGVQTEEGVATRRKRSFNDFLSEELRDNRDTMRLVGRLVCEVWEHRKKLKGERFLIAACFLIVECCFVVHRFLLLISAY